MHNLIDFISEHILVVLIFLIAVFSLTVIHDTLARVVVLLLMMGFYFTYGVLHHQEERTMRLNVALEYLAVAAIVGLVVFVSIR